MKKKYLYIYVFVIAIISLVACDKYDYKKALEPNIYLDYSAKKGLFITCEGNFMFGNASLSFYNKEDGKVDNNIFFNTNKFPLGDVAQSMVIKDNLGFVIVNNSGKVYVIDVNTAEYKGVIKPLVSPRYIHFISDTKGYITDLYSPMIAIFNPSTFEITGYVYIGYGAGRGNVSGTEQMVQCGDYIYVTSWSYNNKVYKIDTRSDKLVDSLVVGKQPNSIVKDYKDRLWVLCDGGYPGSSYGCENPTLWRINSNNFSTEKRFEFDDINSSPSEVIIDKDGRNIYFINGAMLTNVHSKYSGIYKMDVDSESIPKEPVIRSFEKQLFYGISIDAENDDIYVTDAIDYNQDGWLLRYNKNFALIDKLKIGTIPGAFCFKQ